MVKTLKDLTKEVLQFRDERDWAQFHSGKDLAICLAVEASEVQELFLWKKDEQVDQAKLADEIGDVQYALLLLANKFSIDLESALINKLAKNRLKYPISRYHGSNKKYDQ